MGLKRTSHAVYDTKYHLVWTPKYRKWVLRGDVRATADELIKEICEQYGFEIDTMEVAEDHVHLFLSFPPSYSISKVVGMLKSISGSEIFKKHPEVKQQLWGGEFWEDGYFARTVGDRMTAEVIRKYIEYHKDHEKAPKQMELF
jgi:putative transposase